MSCDDSLAFYGLIRNGACKEGTENACLQLFNVSVQVDRSVKFSFFSRKIGISATCASQSKGMSSCLSTVMFSSSHHNPQFCPRLPKYQPPWLTSRSSLLFLYTLLLLRQSRLRRTCHRSTLLLTIRYRRSVFCRRTRHRGLAPSRGRGGSPCLHRQASHCRGRVGDFITWSFYEIQIRYCLIWSGLFGIRH